MLIYGSDETGSLLERSLTQSSLRSAREDIVRDDNGFWWNGQFFWRGSSL